MKPVFRWWSLRSKGLRQEMAVSFGLVILVILVLVGYLFPGASFIFQTRSNIIVVVFILFIITILGFSVIAQMVEPVIKISHEAKRMAEGNLDRQIRLFRNDEIGEMGIALNNMSQQIKENLEELKVFSEKTELINAEINKRILTLSGLVQIGNLVSQNADLNEIITACVEKCLSSGDMTLSCLVLSDSESDEFTIRSTCGPRSSYIKHKDKLKVRTGKGLLGKILLKQDVVIVD